MGVDYARSCYETDFRFFTDDETTTRVRYYFTDAPPLPIPHRFGTRNWLSEGEGNGEPLGEVDGAVRKWVNGVKCGSAPGDHYCGTPEQWLFGSPLPPDPPIETLADGTPVCCVGLHPPMLSSGGQSQGLDRSAVGGSGGQRQDGRGVFQPLLAGGGQVQGRHGTFAAVGTGGQLQGGSGLFLSLGRGGQLQGGTGMAVWPGEGGQQQGGEGLAVWPGEGGQEQGEEGIFARVGAGGQQQGGGGVFATIAVGGQDEGGSGEFAEVPVTGSILFYGSTVTPAGYLPCDGAAVSRTTYSALFGVIGTLYGAGNGTTTFNVPDFRGRCMIGQGTGTGLTARSIGQTGGEETHLLTTGEMPAHAHGENVTATPGGFGGVQGTGSNLATSASGVNTANQGGGGSHQNMPPWGVVAFFIAI